MLIHHVLLYVFRIRAPCIRYFPCYLPDYRFKGNFCFHSPQRDLLLPKLTFLYVFFLNIRKRIYAATAAFFLIGTSIPKVAAPITVSTAAKINTFFMPAPEAGAHAEDGGCHGCGSNTGKLAYKLDKGRSMAIS